MKCLGLILLVLVTLLAAANGETFAAQHPQRLSSRTLGSALDTTQAAAVAKNILRSVKPGGQLSKAIDHIDTVSAAGQPSGTASLDITIQKRDLVSWVYLDTTCTIVKMLFNDSLDAGRYRFFLNPKEVERYFYDSDMAHTVPANCWQILRIGSKRTIQKTAMVQ